MSDHHWIGDAEIVNENHYIGECDNGELWVFKPFRSIVGRRLGSGQWVRFNRLNARHRLTYWRSRRAGRAVWLEVSR